MDEQETRVPEAEAQEPAEALPAEALPQVQPAEEPVQEAEIAPVEHPAEAPPPAEERAPLDLLLDRVEARLAALEAIAHSGHNLDASAVDQIAALVWARINESISKRLG